MENEISILTHPDTEDSDDTQAVPHLSLLLVGQILPRQSIHLDRSAEDSTPVTDVGGLRDVDTTRTWKPSKNLRLLQGLTMASPTHFIFMIKMTDLNNLITTSSFFEAS
jgi:hypothetical protein